MPEDKTHSADYVPQTLVFDVAKFQHLLDDPAITPEEGEAVLKAIWDIVIIILDFGLRFEVPAIDPQDTNKRSNALDAALVDMLHLEDTEIFNQTPTDRAPLACPMKRDFNESR